MLARPQVYRLAANSLVALTSFVINLAPNAVACNGVTTVCPPRDMPTTSAPTPHLDKGGMFMPPIVVPTDVTHVNVTKRNAEEEENDELDGDELVYEEGNDDDPQKTDDGWKDILHVGDGDIEQPPTACPKDSFIIPFSSFDVGPLLKSVSDQGFASELKSFSDEAKAAHDYIWTSPFTPSFLSQKPGITIGFHLVEKSCCPKFEAKIDLKDFEEKLEKSLAAGKCDATGKTP